MTFDAIIPSVRQVFERHNSFIDQLGWILINRDLNGRIRIIAPQALEANTNAVLELTSIAHELAGELASHAHPQITKILYEEDKESVCRGAVSYPLDGFRSAWIVDRLATETNWTSISPETSGAKRIVFFSIKGGVGRSTSLAATAWKLAQSSRKVLVLDVDLESPGLSSALLPAERQPMFGITDWLVEDLVDNGSSVFDSMVASSDLSHDGEIYIVPAHGREPGEYISKLGRVWMPKIHPDGRRESWSNRLLRLLNQLEKKIQPDVILIDSRSGIDETASACLTDLGANLILMFALEGEQTWNGYRLLFEQWQRAQVAEQIRERLRVVAAVVPELDSVTYLEGLREHAYETFVGTLYDELAAPDPHSIGPVSADNGKWRVGSVIEGWSFDEADEGAPHYPWAVNWHRSFAGLKSLRGRLAVIETGEINHIFGPLLDGVDDFTAVEA